MNKKEPCQMSKEDSQQSF